jgi:hypothetical protein
VRQESEPLVAKFASRAAALAEREVRGPLEHERLFTRYLQIRASIPASTDRWKSGKVEVEVRSPVLVEG